METRAAAIGAVGAVPDFAEYVRQRSHVLLRTAYLLTGDSCVAEDLVQTALARVFPRWHRLDHADGNVDGYVLRTLVNSQRSAWRRSRHDGIPMADVPELATFEATDRVIDRQVLVSALGQLPLKQRTALVFRYLLDMTEAQTAAALCCPLGSVKSNTSRGLRALRALLQARDVEPRSANALDVEATP